MLYRANTRTHTLSSECIVFHLNLFQYLHFLRSKLAPFIKTSLRQQYFRRDLIDIASFFSFFLNPARQTIGCLWV